MENNLRHVKGVPFLRIGKEGGLLAYLSAQGASLWRLEYKGLPLTLNLQKEEDFLDSHEYYGRSVGRFAGRLDQGLFDYMGIRFQVPSNEGQNALHGGPDNLSFRVFDTEPTKDGVIFRITSKAGDNAFPGDLKLEVEYVLREDELLIEFRYSVSEPCPINVTNHAFYNAGGSPDILNQELTIPGDKVMTYRKDLIPLGFKDIDEITDFRKGKMVGKDIDHPSLYETRTNGYDHAWLIGEHPFDEPVAVLKGDEVSISLYSDAPAIQFYSDNFEPANLDGFTFKRAALHAGAALEPVSAPLDYASMIAIPNKTYKRIIRIKAEGGRKHGI